MRQYADVTRAPQHEHRNLISFIAGLLFLKRYDNALALIQQQSESHQKVLRFISYNFMTTTLRLLIGKYYRAKELGWSDFRSFALLNTTVTSHNEWIFDCWQFIDNAYNATLLTIAKARDRLSA